MNVPSDADLLSFASKYIIQNCNKNILNLYKIILLHNSKITSINLDKLNTFVIR